MLFLSGMLWFSKEQSVRPEPTSELHNREIRKLCDIACLEATVASAQ
jgi:hypothetical protein